MPASVLSLLSAFTSEDGEAVKRAEVALSHLPKEEVEVVEAFLRTTYHGMVRSFLLSQGYPQDYKYYTVEVLGRPPEEGQLPSLAVLVAVLQPQEELKEKLSFTLQQHLEKHTRIRRLERLVSDIVVEA